MGRFKRTACAIVATGVLTSGVGAALAGPASAAPHKMKRKATTTLVAKKAPHKKKASATLVAKRAKKPRKRVA